jgi:hypothetical protein
MIGTRCRSKRRHKLQHLLLLLKDASQCPLAPPLVVGVPVIVLDGA